MSIWAISDLHLSFSGGKVMKPMEIFGESWDRHLQRLEENWQKTVKAEDTVLLGGDISWAMRLKEAEEDLAWIGALKGRKILLKGNHDYWWEGLKKVQEALPKGMYALQNNSISCEDWTICGVRGWAWQEDAQSQKIYRREVLRLQMALEEGRKTGKKLCCLLHFPPFREKIEETEMTRMLERYGVALCVFGHLHEETLPRMFSFRGIEYRLVSANVVNFTPQKIE